MLYTNMDLYRTELICITIVFLMTLDTTFAGKYNISCIILFLNLYKIN